MVIPEIFMLLLPVFVTLYGILILAFTIGVIRIRRARQVQTPQHTGFVSVIVAVRNESKNLLRILEELRNQDFPCDRLEVIITDDFSEDDTMAIAHGFASGNRGFSLVLLSSVLKENSETGKKSAITRAIARARGDILLFTDADTGRSSSWITSMVAGFASSKVQMVLGTVYFCNEKSLFQKIQSLEFLGLMGVTAGSAALGFPVMCNGANLAYRKSAFLQAGGFGRNLRYASGDDQFMMSAVRKQHGKEALFLNSDILAAISTEAEPTLTGFIHQRMRWVSKSRGNRDPVVIIVGLITGLTHLLLLAGLISGICIPEVLSISLLLWLVKIVLEYPMVWIMGRFFRKEGLSCYYVIAQVFQLIYVPITGLMGLFIPYHWKGRRGL
jgi:cellulose synthase/poly-beta-1,6-N-acetylglucosamine synthase-like glycosyltransferase